MLTFLHTSDGCASWGHNGFVGWIVFVALASSALTAKEGIIGISQHSTASQKPPPTEIGTNDVWVNFFSHHWTWILCSKITGQIEQMSDDGLGKISGLISLLAKFSVVMSNGVVKGTFSFGVRCPLSSGLKHDYYPLPICVPAAVVGLERRWSQKHWLHGRRENLTQETIETEQGVKCGLSDMFFGCRIFWSKIIFNCIIWLHFANFFCNDHRIKKVTFMKPSERDVKYFYWSQNRYWTPDAWKFVERRIFL